MTYILRNPHLVCDECQSLHDTYPNAPHGYTVCAACNKLQHVEIEIDEEIK